MSQARNHPILKGDRHEQDIEARYAGTEVRQYKNPGTGNEVTGVKGKPLPPTPRPGQGYTLVDATKHKR